jgi:hypothetical protein
MLVAILAAPSAFLDVSPAPYPLPKTECGVAYWRINLALSEIVPGWAEWQRLRDMTAIIPVIADAIARAKLLIGQVSSNP